MHASLWAPVFTVHQGVVTIMSGFPASDGLESEGFALSAGTQTCPSASRVSPQQSPVFKLLAPLLTGELAAVHEFGLCGLNWLPPFADKEDEA